MANNVQDYGFIGTADLLANRLQQQGPARNYEVIREAAAEYSRITDTLLGGWSMRTTVAQEQFELAGSGTLQPLDEWGNPLPVLPAGSYQVGYPIQGAGTAFGDNRITRALMSTEEIARLTIDALMKDKDWLFRHAMAALFDNVSWTYNDRIGPDGTKGLGNVTVQPLANSDTVVYNRIGLAQAATVDNHYYAQAAAIADATNPFSTIIAELSEHPSNKGPYVTYAATNLIASIAALTELVEAEVDGINYGGGSDTVSNKATLIGPGSRYIGMTYSGTDIVEMPMMPSGYMITFATGAGPVLRQREYPADALQGLFTEDFNEDGNRQIRRFLRYCGFGVANRVGAVVSYVGTSGTYAIPSGFDAPLAV